ncbi:2-phosphosulfolactate phosphatase [Candidatus Palauibacter polyketidifaciens]|uniref:2-phosphosulfolactate phosphatase n=1 Tax=Candidatus Palauibacter polyketidifaciens TaxID=3056740 RepID=UPI00139EC42A|nr:2-phosphosulfolactate phosphatase [Candidatus Palauibacter polyketidifaciens]MDE2721027.1 2-phosphosulfolactate phosphatase [Candidatus Palauibacter polyketidifaciens]MYE33513.1 2-phosphosulfolactate phosphatase [Gemmatimonadales bacterium]
MSAIDVLWLPEELEIGPPRGRVTIVVDVIRATTSIATAFAAGAARVIPVRTVEEARAEAARDGGALLCGERRGLPPRGFDLGNAPGEFERGSVAGRTLVFTTTNGTAAIEAARAAGVGSLRLGCFRNAGAVSRRVAADANAAGRDVAIVCAGRRGRVSMDDAWCAGHLVERLVRTVTEAELTDGARAAQALSARLGPPTATGLAGTAAGRLLHAIGRSADLAVCAGLDDLEVVPIWRDGALVGSRGGEDA